MFSKKSLKPAPAPPPRSRNAPQLALAAISNPYVGASGAALLLLITLLALVAIMGDPKAGEPQVRISLAKIAQSAAPAGWREALVAQQPGGQVVTEELYQLSDKPGPIGGQAVITLPGARTQHGRGLPPAPIAGLHSQGPGGPLPIIAADGRTPAQAYARPFTADGRPRIALVIGGLGLNARATREAIETLPPQVTLSFVPYSEGLQAWIDLAREHGHEVLLEAPMEPTDYPENDPGPYTLMAGANSADTVRKLEWLLSRATGYFGLTNYLGSRFMASDKAMAAFSGALKTRGLAFIDDGSAAGRGGGVPRASADRIIDEQLSNEAIDQQLLALEAGALQHGQALGSGFAYPVTIDQVARWAAQVEQRGYQLAPASALMVRK
ncbi:MAG: divergent polysaccharide deacetylase family protein [Phenylobacterium sp.]|uniref:divergent polysaccharide deacetylase family protein n=1 Tax=Phenylobacterium sp. TaxID=1871053 RepID=UPI00391D1C6E